MCKTGKGGEWMEEMGMEEMGMDEAGANLSGYDVCLYVMYVAVPSL